MTGRAPDLAHALRRSGFRGKLIVAFVLCAFLVAALVLARQEQQARAASEGAHQLLDQVIAAGETLTDEQVHERLGRSPDEVRRLGAHRLAEEYRWSGNFGSYTVYVYYVSAAAKLMTAVSINQEHPDWKQTDQ